MSVFESLVKRGFDLSELGLTPQDLSALPDSKSMIDESLSWAEQEGNHVITIADPEYPDLLKEIQNPPLLLFAKGNLCLLKSHQIAMVGSRNPTPIGLEIATYFAKDLVEYGVIITSGLASGIDAASHRGALLGKGKTIAVMGTGLNNIYPRSNLKLATEIVVGGGLLLSEFPLHAKAKAWHFPLRNRIISGLSLGTLVIEAARKSGSLITARLASEQNREVFAVPGSIYNHRARGCHYLIKHGAKLVEQPEDILEEFPKLFQDLSTQNINSRDHQVKNKLDSSHQKLLDCMGFEVVTVDTLVTRLGLKVAQISTMLLELEIQGLIQTSFGGYIRK